MNINISVTLFEIVSDKPDGIIASDDLFINAIPCFDLNSWIKKFIFKNNYLLCVFFVKNF